MAKLKMFRFQVVVEDTGQILLGSSIHSVTEPRLRVEVEPLEGHLSYRRLWNEGLYVRLSVPPWGVNRLIDSPMDERKLKELVERALMLDLGRAGVLKKPKGV